MTTSIIDTGFASVVEHISRTAPADGGVAAALIAQMHRLRDQPPTDEIEQVLRRRVSRDRTLSLLFAPEPTPESIGLYADLMSPAHTYVTVRSACVGLCYLSHAHSWPLASELVRTGGLISLAALVDKSSGAPTVVRGQALEVLHLCTSHPAYDWFAAPSGAEDDAALHRGLLALARTRFLATLCEFRAAPPYPGASLLALQLLAFWLSWARRLHTGGQPLRLSRLLLAELKAWAAPVAPLAVESAGGAAAPPGPVIDVVHGTTSAGGEGADSAEERELASRLYEDFNRFPAADEEGASASSEAASGATLPRPSTEVSGVVWADAGQQVLLPVHPTPAPMPLAVDNRAGPGVVDVVNGLREAANAAFRAGKWGAATDGYSDAIGLMRPLVATPSVPMSGGASASRGDASLDALLVTLLSNRAVARLRGAGYGAGAAPDLRILRATLTELRSDATAEGSSVAQLRSALADCDEALLLDAGHAKSAVRRAQALAALHRFDEARAAARAAQRYLSEQLQFGHRRSAGTPSAAAADLQSSLAQVASLLATISVCAEAVDSWLPQPGAPSVGAGHCTPTPTADTDVAAASGAAAAPLCLEASIAGALSHRREFGGGGLAPGDRDADYALPLKAAAMDGAPFAGSSSSSSLGGSSNSSGAQASLGQVGASGPAVRIVAGGPLEAPPAIGAAGQAAPAPAPAPGLPSTGLPRAPDLPDFGAASARAAAAAGKKAGGKAGQGGATRIVQLGF